jgi:hypothetical protein
MYNAVMGRRKLNLVRWSVHTAPAVKAALEHQAAENGRSLALEAGRLLEEILRERNLLLVEPAREEDRPAS